MSASEGVRAIRFEVLGNPQGKGRPRFGKGRTFTDAATTMAENEIRAAWRGAGAQRIPDGEPIELLVVLEVPRPAAHLKKDGTLSTEGRRHPRPRKKPDIDNAIKLVMDALNGLAYRDDVDVVTAYVVRNWADVARTGIAIRSVAA